MRPPLFSRRSSSSANKSLPRINRRGATARTSAPHASPLEVRSSTAAAMTGGLAFHAARRNRNQPLPLLYRCKFCYQMFPTPQSLGGHHNSHRNLKVRWKETRARSVRSGRERHPPQVAPPAALNVPINEEGLVTVPVLWAASLNMPSEPTGAILQPELGQLVEEEQGARQDPNPSARDAFHFDDLNGYDDAMTWAEGLLVDLQDEVPPPPQAGYKGVDDFSDSSWVNTDMDLDP